MSQQCKCSAYPFPHRWGGGKCDKWSAVEFVWENSSRCRDCTYFRTETAPHGERIAWCDLLDRAGITAAVQPEMCPELELAVKEKIT